MQTKKVMLALSVIRERQTTAPTLVAQAVDCHVRFDTFTGGKRNDGKAVIAKTIENLWPAADTPRSDDTAWNFDRQYVEGLPANRQQTLSGWRKSDHDTIVFL